jgi:hypothetical protein
MDKNKVQPPVQNSAGVWVKALTCLPDQNQIVIWKIANGDDVVIVGYGKLNGLKYFTAANLYWLNESQSPALQPSGCTLQQMEDAIRSASQYTRSLKKEISDAEIDNYILKITAHSSLPVPAEAVSGADKTIQEFFPCATMLKREDCILLMGVFAARLLLLQPPPTLPTDAPMLPPGSAPIFIHSVEYMEAYKKWESKIKDQ